MWLVAATANQVLKKREIMFAYNKGKQQQLAGFTT